eukprot:4058725-Alexandrium_andersonii.AAC.1
MAPAHGTPRALPVTANGTTGARAAAWADCRPWDGARTGPWPGGDGLGGPHGEQDGVGRNSLSEDRAGDPATPAEAGVLSAAASGTRVLPRPGRAGREKASA